MLPVAHFDGLESEQALPWRVADSMSVRTILEYEPEKAVADHSTLL